MAFSPKVDWIAQASKALGVQLTRHTWREACGPCPNCGGKDRFIAFDDGGAWCRRCHMTAWWIENPDEGRRQMALSRQEKAEHQQELLARMASCTDWQAYHKALLNGSGAHLGDWYEHGMSDDDIEKWGLGWCAACPCAPESASLTIPVFRKQTLVDIRHRLIGGERGDKYRSHVAGLVASVFNVDALHSAEMVIVVEGEKKAIASVRAGFAASLGMPGAQFVDPLLRIMADLLESQRVILALDPDQTVNAECIALQIGSAARVADFPAKPDDFLLRYGAKSYAEVIKQARPVRVKR